MKAIFEGWKALFRPQVELSNRKALIGYVDSLIQTFENCRAGLSDHTIAGGEDAAEHYFLDLYNKELPRLQSSIQLHEGYMPAETRARFFDEVCTLLRKVVIPAYVRLALHFTKRERNDFYLVPRHLQFLERIGWAAGGIFLGAFVVWAPFIPIWSKEWVLPFLIAGLIFPSLRRFFSIKQYENELNKLVTKTDLEIDRIEMAYLTGNELLSQTEGEDAGEFQEESKERRSDSRIKN